MEMRRVVLTWRSRRGTWFWRTQKPYRKRIFPRGSCLARDLQTRRAGTSPSSISSASLATMSKASQPELKKVRHRVVLCTPRQKY